MPASFDAATRGDEGPSNLPPRLAELRAEVVACAACPRLVEWSQEVAAHPRASFSGQRYWARPVFGFGDPEAAIGVVGLAPAAHGANRTGRMFTGDRSGEWLFGALWRAGLANQASSSGLGDGLELAHTCVTAVLRCAPPQNRPLPAERDACLPFLRRELALLGNLSVLVALGAFAYENLGRALAAGRLPRFAHGAETTMAGPGGNKEIAVLCSYHPSQRNTFTKLLTEKMFDSVFARARSLAGI